MNESDVNYSYYRWSNIQMLGLVALSMIGGYWLASRNRNYEKVS